MIGPEIQREVDRLLQVLEAREPIIYELGTPQLQETAEVDELVGMGRQIVPHLVALLKTAQPKSVASVVLVLGKIGDPSALEPLRELRGSYQSIEHKSEWDYAIIGQCNTAIHDLENR